MALKTRLNILSIMKSKMKSSKWAWSVAWIKLNIPSFICSKTYRLFHSFNISKIGMCPEPMVSCNCCCQMALGMWSLPAQGQASKAPPSTLAKWCLQLGKKSQSKGRSTLWRNSAASVFLVVQRMILEEMTWMWVAVRPNKIQKTQTLSVEKCQENSMNFFLCFHFLGMYKEM